jgi:hypothetical protein
MAKIPIFLKLLNFFKQKKHLLDFTTLSFTTIQQVALLISTGIYRLQCNLLVKNSVHNNQKIDFQFCWFCFFCRKFYKIKKTTPQMWTSHPWVDLFTVIYLTFNCVLLTSLIIDIHVFHYVMFLFEKKSFEKLQKIFRTNLIVSFSNNNLRNLWYYEK